MLVFRLIFESCGRRFEEGELLSTLDSSFLSVTVIYHISELNVKWFSIKNSKYFMGIYNISQNETFLKNFNPRPLRLGAGGGLIFLRKFHFVKSHKFLENKLKFS